MIKEEEETVSVITEMIQKQKKAESNEELDITSKVEVAKVDGNNEKKHEFQGSDVILLDEAIEMICKDDKSDKEAIKTQEGLLNDGLPLTKENEIEILKVKCLCLVS